MASDIDYLTPLTKEEKEILLLALETSELVGEIWLEWSTETEETTWNTSELELVEVHCRVTSTSPPTNGVEIPLGSDSSLQNTLKRYE